MGPLIREFGLINQHQSKFYFDLSDSTTHYGDRLFFLPLIDSLVKKGCTITLSNKDFFTNQLLLTLCGYELSQSELPAMDDLIIIPQPSYLHCRNRYRSGILINFSDSSSKKGIAYQLVDSFKKYFSLQIDCTRLLLDKNKAPHSALLPDGANYFLFSNYIISGGFRRLFVDEGKLHSQCVAMHKMGFKIVHIGSLNDIQSDNRSYDYVDIDLRGTLTISQLIELALDSRVNGAICYDNFLMHLMGICNKKSYVLFRGRLRQNAARHHIMHVNNTFYENEILLSYL